MYRTLYSTRQYESLGDSYGLYTLVTIRIEGTVDTIEPQRGVHDLACSSAHSSGLLYIDILEGRLKDFREWMLS